MSRILITGSADGLGQMAARRLLARGHRVVLHARSQSRADEALAASPGADAALVGDLSSLEGMTAVARQANALGTFDAVIHNAAVGYRQPRRVQTKDGLEELFAINALAPYLLTALMHPPRRLVYLSSGLHRSGHLKLDDLNWTARPWNGQQAYCDSKLQDVLIAFAVARLWPRTFSNALEPGWVATKMGGAGAPDNLELGAVTQAWLAAGDDAAARTTAGYFYHLKPREPNQEARDVALQDRLLDICREISGVDLIG
jgi:NAD(P)-dependent dehydrogenase (short-subunit alcohol dehydrogenase family)